MAHAKTIISTRNAPAPRPQFHQGVRKGPFIQVSGQGPVDPSSGEYVFAGNVFLQTLRTLENVRAIVEASGATFDDVMMLRVHLSDKDHFSAMNEAYGSFVAEHCPGGVLPSRTTVFVGLPHASMLVEIDAFAIFNGEEA